MATAGAHPPIISLKDFEQRKAQIKDQLMAAATHSGFLYIRDSCLQQDLIDRAFDVHKRYFELSQTEKCKLPRVDWAQKKWLGHNFGSSTAGTLVHEAHWKWWPVHEEASSAYPPDELVPGFRATCEELMATAPAVYDQILACYALGLGLPEDFFKTVADVNSTDNNSIFTCNHYPATSGNEYKPGTYRIVPHTDESLITLLLTSPGSPGLELAAGKDGKAVDSSNGMYEVEAWHPCPHIPGCITVNIGDALQIYSNGLLKSNYHRVRLPQPGEPTAERYSLVSFLWPNNSAVMGPDGINFGKFMAVKSEGFANIYSKKDKLAEEAEGLNVAFGMPTVSATA